MQHKLLLFLSILGTQTYAQNNLPIIHAQTDKVKIIENKLLVTPWNLDPSQKPDVYVTGKISQSQHLQIVTDIDSLTVLLKPNEQFDFIVLKNNKDTCYTRFQSYANKGYHHETDKLKINIPFTLSPYNNIQVATVLDERDSIQLHFDTGASDFYLTKTAIKKYLYPNKENITMQDISDHTFRIGQLKWEKQQIYPNDITAQGNDGLFGWNVFDGKILVVDYDHNKMTVQSELPKWSKDYESFPIEYMRDQFRIKIGFELAGKKYEDDFLFDTGFQKAVMLDKDVLTQQQITTDGIKVLNTTILRNSRNEEIPLNTIQIDKFFFGKYTIANVPSELNDYNKPTGYPTHFIGSDIIKRFNLIFDFQKNMVYMKPNKNFKQPYFDQIHKS